MLDPTKLYGYLYTSTKMCDTIWRETLAAGKIWRIHRKTHLVEENLTILLILNKNTL